MFHSCIFPCLGNTLDVWFRVGNTLDELCVGNTLDELCVGNTLNELCVGNTLDELCVGNTLDVWFRFRHLNIINRSFTKTSFSSDKRSD